VSARPGARTQSADTDPAIEERQIAAWRAMTPADKLHIVGELIRASEALALAGIDTRHPGASDRERRLRLAALRVDRELMVRWLDWDPEREGY
jgi:hypothetical protein